MSLILVCGSRDFRNDLAIEQRLRYLPTTAVIMHGGATGADTIADRIARDLGLDIIAEPARWLRYGRAAGPIRNRRMLDRGPDLVLAFKTRRVSRGTDHMIRIASWAGVPVDVWVEGEGWQT